jgi:RNA polymerase sigma-70 factor, ECF subfamily
MQGELCCGDRPVAEGRVAVGRAAQWEENLVARARGGDAAAFEELYVAHRDAVYTLCLSLCGDREEAQDLLQESFVRAYRALPRFRGEAQFLTWVHRIAVNLFRSSLRRRHRAPGLPPPAPGPRPGEGEEVRAALQQLQPQHRLVLALRYSQTLSYQEIADLLGWSLAKVKATIHRAKRAFREVYESETDHAMS